MSNGQLSFGFEPAARSHIHFFALRPEDDAACAIVEAGRWCSVRYGLSGRLYGADRLHVSLVSVESAKGFRKGEVAAARRAGSHVRTAPFEVAFDRVCTFGGRKTWPIVLRCSAGVAELRELRSALRLGLMKEGLWPGTGGFEPHVTMLWDRHRVPEIELPQPIRWTVEQFFLVKSLVGYGRHVDLAKWPLHLSEWNVTGGNAGPVGAG